MIHELSKMQFDEFYLENRFFILRDELRELFEDSMIQA